ncbi:hypothetical protein G5C60_14195 [Streptomyces sp. HC44]|uniref:Uncharacterized protein n=1 Tax=Streptomyces scabichelini TaxID=2711217 RepID=A0A6G4V4C4_9ACTN|nr:hypothetical protein [Streptomyces scabichelini]NGO08727.1 hypothetical protein [Streptomyces scabichelini]
MCKALVPFLCCPHQLGLVCLDLDHVLIEIQVLVLPPGRRSLKREVDPQHSRAVVPPDLAEGEDRFEEEKIRDEVPFRDS